MKKGILLIFLTCFLISCSTYYDKLAQRTSPDKKGVAKLLYKSKLGEVVICHIGRWAKLIILRNSKIIYDTGYVEYGAYQNGNFSFDLLWSPDSKHLAYRMLDTLKIIAIDGKVKSFKFSKDISLASSFKWLNNNNLLIVSKSANAPLDMYGYPVYWKKYLTTTSHVKILMLNINSGISERFVQKVQNPVFIYHSIKLVNDEISPYSSRVAFSDGNNICIYDDSKNKIISKTPINGSIEGIWWINDDELILGIALFSKKKQFYKYRIEQKKTVDITKKLLPYWNAPCKSSKWFKKALH